MVVNFAQTHSLWLSAQNKAELKRIFQSITPESCPSSYNFHMHTVCSDGRLQPEQLIDQAIALGLSGLTITDHHSVDGYRRAQAHLEQRIEQSDGHSGFPRLWTGMEINAGLLGDEVHILAYAFDPEHDALKPYMQGNTAFSEHYPAERVIQAIQAAGGLAVLAHPSRYKRSAEELIPAAADRGIDGIETYYAYNNPNPWQPSPRQTETVRQLGDAYGLLHTCGTDTHGLSLLQRL